MQQAQRVADRTMWLVALSFCFNCLLRPSWGD